jgi:hypothetical protein
MTPIIQARLLILAGQAEHRRAIAAFHARHAADQQARINALLQETIAALAELLDVTPLHRPPGRPARRAS